MYYYVIVSENITIIVFGILEPWQTRIELFDLIEIINQWFICLINRGMRSMYKYILRIKRGIW